MTPGTTIVERGLRQRVETGKPPVSPSLEDGGRRTEDEGRPARSPIIAIIGEGGCGKDTVARMLYKKLGLKFLGSTSWFMLPYVSSMLGEPQQEAWETRNTSPERRALWRKLIDDFRKDDATRLIRSMLDAGAQVISGIRVRAEFLPIRDRFTHVIWIARPGTPKDGTLELAREDCDYEILNDGTLEELELRVEGFIAAPENFRISVKGEVSSEQCSVTSGQESKTIRVRHPDGTPAKQAELEKIAGIESQSAISLPQLNGPWIRTFTGWTFELLNPTPEVIHIVDIAHHLSQITRFTGALDGFYSVASHSLKVSYAMENLRGPKAGMAGLLHDAAEAYIGDINAPLKSVLKPLIDPIEQRIKAVIAATFDCDFGRWKEDGIRVDLLAMKWEAMHLQSWYLQDWNLLPDWWHQTSREELDRMFGAEIYTPDWETVNDLFLRRFKQLEKAIGK